MNFLFMIQQKSLHLSVDLIFLCGDEGGNGLFKVNELALNWAKASDIL